jgi:hypothetical protein
VELRDYLLNTTPNHRHQPTTNSPGALHARVCVRLLRISLRASAHWGRTSQPRWARKLRCTTTGTVELSKDLNDSYCRVTIMNTADRLMTVKEPAEMLCVPASTMYGWRSQRGKGHPATASAAASATDASG